MQEALSYRALFNRTRTVVFVHPRPGEIADLIDTFQAQGFMTNVAVNLLSLGRLASSKVPDAIVAYAPAGQTPVEVALIKDIARGTRIYLVADEAPAVAEIVRAVRSGALSVFVRPFHVTDVLGEVEADLAGDLRVNQNSVTVAGIASLTMREREVLEIILRGGSNKEAGKQLHISPRTIEVHRAHVMQKLGARNTAEMVRIALGR